MSDYTTLSELELAGVIESAQRALREKMDHKRKDVILQIKELASSINVNVEIVDNAPTKISGRKGSKVAPKYQNPYNNAQTWTGRGMKPKWLSSMLDAGRSIEEFEIKH